MKWMQTIAGVLAIVGLGFIAGVGHSLVRDQPIVLKLPPTSLPNPGDIDLPEAADLGSANPEPSGTDLPDTVIDPLDIAGPPGTLTLRQAYKLFEEGAYFIDARHQDEYDEAHISYALFLSAQQVRTKGGLDELSTIPPDVPIVIYCVGGDCDASENAMIAIQQTNLGFTDIRIMGRGFEDWADAGLPVEYADESADQSTGGESP